MLVQATHYDEAHLFKLTERGLFRWDGFEWVRSNRERKGLRVCGKIYATRKPKKRIRRDYSHIKAIIMDEPKTLSQIHEVLGGDKVAIKSAIHIMKLRGEVEHVGLVGRFYTFLVNKDYEQ